MKKTIIIIIYLVSFLQIKLYSQQPHILSDSTIHGKIEMIYLHTDREFYFPGDTIWYKAYYLDRKNDHFISGYNNLNVDLIDEKGKPVFSQIIPIIDGTGASSLLIPKNYLSGKYLIRAFTDSQVEYGEDLYFHKAINISSLKTSEDEQTTNLKYKKSRLKEEVDIAFLPEGGVLLAGQSNMIGFKATDETGSGIDIHGMVFKNDSIQVTNISTSYNGLGVFSFTPSLGDVYTVKIEEDSDYRYNFQNIIPEGIKLELVSDQEDMLWFQVSANSDKLLNKPYYFAILHRGETIYYSKYIQGNNKSKIKIIKAVLKPGINRFVLLDRDMKPISERLYFLNSIDINSLSLSLNQEKFETRSEVKLEILDALGSDENYYSNLSVAVVSESAIGANGPEMNLLSYLLIDSELRGNIESPSDYFVDEIELESKVKLDLLMLTQGWSSYIWNNTSTNNTVSDYKNPFGLSISGRVEKLAGRKPIINGKIDIKVLQDNYLFYSQSFTDHQGRFTFDSIIFSDTALVYIQAYNKNNKLSTEIYFDPIFGKRPNASNTYIPKGFESIVFPKKLYEYKFYSEQAMKDYIKDSGLFNIEEVVIAGQRVKSATNFRIYGIANTTFTISDKDLMYENAISYLNGKVPGAIIQGNNIIIRGLGSVNSSSEPLFLIDGMRVSKENFVGTPMAAIDKIEVLKSGIETAIFGMRGANGVVSIITRTGSYYIQDDLYLKGTISNKVAGYEPYRVFYSPKYDTININNSMPDHRTTLYWNPYVILDNGTTSLSFYTSDDISNFKIYIEGLNSEGKVCLGSANFEVNQHRSK